MQLQIAIIATALTGVFGSVAQAQMNNQPFSFGSAQGRISAAGRQAIIDQELGGSTPENLFRSPGGLLLDVERGPGGVVIVRTPHDGSTILQTGRRSPVRGGAGVFNSFFVKFDGLPFRSEIGTSSGAMVDGWTGNVHGYITIGGNSVDQWTSMVYRSY